MTVLREGGPAQRLDKDESGALRDGDSVALLGKTNEYTFRVVNSAEDVGHR